MKFKRKSFKKAFRKSFKKSLRKSFGKGRKRLKFYTISRGGGRL